MSWTSAFAGCDPRWTIPSHGSCFEPFEASVMLSRVRSSIHHLRSTPPLGHSLAFRLTAWYTTASLLAVAVATGLLYFGLSTNLKKLSEQLLADELDVCRA